MNYALLVTKNGKNILSGNPIEFQFGITPYNNYVKKQSLYVLVTVYVSFNENANIWEEVKTEKIYPDNDGLVSIDISSIADAYLEYFTPPVNLNQQMILAPGQALSFKTNASLFVNDQLKASVNSQGRYIKAGASYEYFNTTFSPVTSLDTPAPLLISNNVEKVSVEDIFFLYYLLKSGTSGDINAQVTVRYLDSGAENSVTALLYADRLTPLTDTTIACMPAGYNQLNLSSLIPNGAIPIYYEIAIIRFDDITDLVGQAFFAPIRYNIEQRNFYRSYQLLYRNSLGGLTPIRLRGQVDFEADYIYQQASRLPQPSYLQDGNLLPETIQDYAEETPKFTGDTGFLNRYEAERMRDFFLSKQCFEVKDSRLVPIVINTKNTKYFSNRDNLISIQVQWQHAFINNFYSDKVLPSSSCPAIDNFTWVQSADDEIAVYWAFPFGYNYGRITITFPGEDPQYFFVEKNSGSQKLQFVRPDSAVGVTVNLDVTAQIVCDRYNDTPSFGQQWPTNSVALLPILLPVANDDNYSISSGYNSYVTLEGSVLANDYDFNDNPIEVVAVATPTATTAGGLYTITSAGIISYKPATSVYSGIDSFDYVIRRVGTTETVTATAFINVSTDTITIFAKLVLRNQYQSSNSSEVHRYAEVWIDFFSDPACLFPKIVNTLTVHYRKTVVNLTDLQELTTVTTDYTVVCNGDKQLLYNGEIFYKKYSKQLNGFQRTTTISLLAGTGYTPL